MQNSVSPLRPGAWCVLGEPTTATALASAGPAWLCLDAQHGAFDRAGVIAVSQRLVGRGPELAVRAPANDAAFLGAALDAGVRIVIVPLVDSVADAEAAVRASLYPPRGGRSWGPMTGYWGAPVPTAAEADERVRVWAMIETRAGLDAVERIAAVPGIAGLFVGPFDLALALGVGLDELLAADADGAPLRRIAAACAAAGLTAGAFAGDAARSRRLAELGFTDIAVVTDAGALADGAARALGSAAARAGY